MVMQGPATAREIAAWFNFAYKPVDLLASRTDKIQVRERGGFREREREREYLFLVLERRWQDSEGVLHSSLVSPFSWLAQLTTCDSEDTVQLKLGE